MFGIPIGHFIRFILKKMKDNNTTTGNMQLLWGNLMVSHVTD